jgi:hypothetical protein
VAIASSEIERFHGVEKSTVCNGPPQPCPDIGCLDVVPACAQGMCAARAPVYVDAAQFDRTCREDGDCKLIVTGEVCSSCRCGSAAVNAGAYSQYLALIDGIVGVECNPGPSPCDCAFPTEVRCVKPSPSSELGQCDVSF